MTEQRNNLAGFRVTLDGLDLTDRISPRLIGLRLTEKRAGGADELELDVHDHDGLLAMPRKGAILHVAIGWLQGVGVPIGLIDKGSFMVDEAEHVGPPDRITIRARSADLTDGFRVRKDRSWTGTTVGAVLTQIASDNGLIPQIDAGLAAKPIPALGSGAKSDMAHMREFGRRFDAIATVKAGKLLFMPVGTRTTPGGKTLSGEILTRSEADSHRYSLADRGQHDGVEAVYHDQDLGERQTVTAGAAGAKKRKRIRKTFPNKIHAQQAADAEASRMARRKAVMDLTLSLGRADLFPNRPITLSGWKAEIDEWRWVVEEASHSIDGDGGLRTSLKLESTS